MSRPLLAVDGDSFAHRAYHALPKSIRRAGGRPGNALVGFTNMLLRPGKPSGRGPSSSGGTRWRCRPTATRRSRCTRRGGLDPELLEQLALLPSWSAQRKSHGERRPATRRTTSWRRRSPPSALEAEPCSSRRPTATPSSWQDLDVTILQPLRGVSSIARVGPEEVRERYEVEPEQVPDFIALRGDPSD